MLIKLEENAYIDFSTRDPATGNKANLDSYTVTVHKDGVDMGLVITTDFTVANPKTGQYVVTLPVAAAKGFEVGKQYSVKVDATIGTFNDEDTVDSFQVSEENHGQVIDKSIASVETNIVGTGNVNWVTATTVDVVSFNGDTDSVTNLVSVLLGTGHTDDVRLSAAQLRLENNLPNVTPLLINATYSGVGVQNAVGIIAADGDGMVVSGSSNDILADITGSVNSVADPTTIWSYVEVSGISGGKNAFEVICMSAAGAGAGTVDVGVAPGTTRDETFRYLNDTDAFVVSADEEGNRIAVNLNP